MRYVIIALLVISASAPAQAPEGVLQSMLPNAEVSSFKLLPAAGGKPGELVVIQSDGRVRQYRVGATKGFTEFSGDLVLENADRILINFAAAEKGGEVLLHALTPKGYYVFSRNEQGQFAGPGKRVVGRARFRVRVGGPRQAAFLQDVNGDQQSDLVVPGRDACEIWLKNAEGYRKTARVRVKIRIDQSIGSGVGDDRFYQSVSIPDLDVRDMNGDGRDDVVIMRGSQTRIHRQQEDGTIPFDPDVILDLDKFKDTSPKATVRPGRTLAGNEKARLLIRDLDGDAIPDYVISHRRKVWVFHGDKSGPQFTKPSKILKVADDITFIWLARVNDDAFADLLVVRVEVPTVGTLITGLFGSIDVSMRVLGYQSQNGRGFATKPEWKNEITFVFPSLGEIMKNPEALIKRFEDAASSIRESFLADVNGDKKEDLVLFDKEVTKAEIWHARDGDDLTSGDDLDAIVLDVFFDKENREWDLDRMFGFIESMGNTRATRWTKGRAADRVVPFRNDDVHIPKRMMHADLNGDGKEELLVAYRVLGRRSGVRFDLVAPK